MDKTNRALTAAADNAEELRLLRKRLAKLESTVLSKCGAKWLAGRATGGKTSFGTLVSDGGTAVIVTFLSGSAALKFCGSAVVSGASPLFAVLPAGSGALELSAERANASAIALFGAT